MKFCVKCIHVYATYFLLPHNTHNFIKMLIHDVYISMQRNPLNNVQLEEFFLLNECARVSIHNVNEKKQKSHFAFAIVLSIKKTVNIREKYANLFEYQRMMWSFAGNPALQTKYFNSSESLFTAHIFTTTRNLPPSFPFHKFFLARVNIVS